MTTPSLTLRLAVLLTLLAAPVRGEGGELPTVTRPHVVRIQMRPRENVPAALIRAGVDAAEASRAAAALADEFDTVNPHPGKALILTLLADGPRRARLMEMDFSPRDFDSISLTRSGDGQFHLTRAESPIYTTLIHTRGLINGSLYLSIVEAGVEPDMASMVVALFGRRLDLTRDVGSGDRFRLVFRQRRHVDGEAVGGPELLYADVTTKAGTARLYRYQPDGAAVPQWLDGRGDAGRFALLATPVDGARVTSAFGMRLHPLLGYTRMHQGVDFGAPAGTPVLAAGDGVVEEARWAGDYGRWLKIRHGSNLETGYGHLSGWAPGVGPGSSVRQGQVVAYVGATGLATGPHLHFEVFLQGKRINPRGAPALTASTPDPVAAAEFRKVKAEIDAAIA